MCFKKFRVFAVTAALPLLFFLSGCDSDMPLFPTFPTEPPRVLQTQPATDPTQATEAADLVEQLSTVVTEDTIASLDQYPNLKEVDLSGSTCYAAIAEYMQTHPQVQVSYTVSLGTFTTSHNATDLTLEPGNYDPDTLLENLQYLTALKTLHLPRMTLTPEEYTALVTQYPQIALTHSVEFLGSEYPSDTEQLDLSALKPQQVPEAAKGLSMLPKLSYVELMTASGTSELNKAEVKQLMDAAPNSAFHYTFTLYGKTVSTTDETIAYKNVKIGNEGEAAIREALDILRGCTYFKLENCGIDNEVMASIRADYPDTKVVWRVYFGNSTYLTDVVALRSVYGVENDNCDAMKYCTDVKYMDLGHNDTLTDISFIRNMPELEICIISGVMMTDLEPFSGCKKLEWLELASCYDVTDLTPLASCESLRFLNISYTKVTSLEPLDDLPLERFVYLGPRASAKEQELFRAIHPDCWTRFRGTQPYGIVWRYNDEGYTYFDYYKKIREIFNYDGIAFNNG